MLKTQCLIIRSSLITKLAQKVTFLTCIQKVPSLNLECITGNVPVLLGCPYRFRVRPYQFNAHKQSHGSVLCSMATHTHYHALSYNQLRNKRSLIM
jgi:hypothetical protein